ncbi:unnamed protein product [Microthlaspi erraticum]|uniref:Uncharacterized protein n=1 Tax=Microthlaspi erraticum TaxID=1685480 RepID=A0A6D2IZ21_9BRAS|nr:unnamed protein product [Microthlaspi erraticum]
MTVDPLFLLPEPSSVPGFFPSAFSAAALERVLLVVDTIVPVEQPNLTNRVSTLAKQCHTQGLEKKQIKQVENRNKNQSFRQISTEKID